MGLKMDMTYVIKPGIVYIHSKYHRDNSYDKSQWTISEPEERNCFKLMLDLSWYANQIGWGLHLVSGHVEYLGLSRYRRRPLFIAKFVDGTGEDVWHGYPADHIWNDIPSHIVLRNWREKGLISAAKVRKILRGQICDP